MVLVDQINQGTEQIYKDIYGDQWEEGLKYEHGKLLVRPSTTLYFYNVRPSPKPWSQLKKIPRFVSRQGGHCQDAPANSRLPQEAQEDCKRRRLEFEASERRRKEQDRIPLRHTGLYLDDYDPRY